MKDSNGFSNSAIVVLLGNARLPLRLIPKKAVLPILQGQLRGKKWVVGAGNHSYWLGSYEMHKRQAFEREVKPGMVVFDVGANVGFYSLLAAYLAGEGGKVYAFEPSERNVIISQHTALNKIERLWLLKQQWRNNGEALFDRAPALPPVMFRTTGPAGEAGQPDKLFAAGEIQPPDAMEADVEGRICRP